VDVRNLNAVGISESESEPFLDADHTQPPLVLPTTTIADLLPTYGAYAEDISRIAGCYPIKIRQASGGFYSERSVRPYGGTEPRQAHAQQMMVKGR
jgi:hypothetical protein